MIKASELSIDVTSLGDNMMYVASSEYYDYVDGVRSKDRTGYKYDVLLPLHAMERFTVKVPGDRRIPEDTVPLTLVVFENLKVRPYIIDKTLGLSATATNVRVVAAEKGH